jgi:hypothetical protein
MSLYVHNIIRIGPLLMEIGGSNLKVKDLVYPAMQLLKRHTVNIRYGQPCKVVVRFFAKKFVLFLKGGLPRRPEPALEAVKEARLWHNSGEVRQLAAADAKTQRLLKGQCIQHTGCNGTVTRGQVCLGTPEPHGKMHLLVFTPTTAKKPM